MNEERAWELYDIAHYLLNTTYPAIKDSKILLTVLQNINQSLNTAMDVIMGKSTYTFRQKILKLQSSGLNTELIEEINDLVELHQKSAIEFSKEGSLVICNDDYTIKYINNKNVQELLANTKLFLENHVKRRKT